MKENEMNEIKIDGTKIKMKAFKMKKTGTEEMGTEETGTKEISVKDLEIKCIELKKKVITMIYKAQSGHPGGSLSAADYITALYFREMRLDPSNPRWAERDRFVLSKGHVCPIQYAALAACGYFDEKILATLRREGSILQGHPDMNKCPGIDISTGSLGQGLACAVGMALAGKADKKSYRVFAVLGDGECQEGEIWEAAQTANKYCLDNLVVFVDNNGLQLDGTTDQVMPNLDLGKKFEAFGFEIFSIDGHNMAEIQATLDKAGTAENKKPKCIVGHTVKGHGISYMENQCAWHGAAPNQEQYEQAVKELDEQYERAARERDEEYEQTAEKSGERTVKPAVRQAAKEPVKQQTEGRKGKCMR